MSKLAIQYVSPQDVRPYTGNARTHSKRQIRQIADSIQRFGFANPVLVSGNHEVIAGHGRLAAAKLLGLASVPIVVLADMTEADRRAYVIGRNAQYPDSGPGLHSAASDLEGNSWDGLSTVH
jgi:ParB-like chromosome segregation protein Spo0J